MRGLTKLQAVCVSLTVVVGLAVTPAVAGFAQSVPGKRPAPVRQSSACGALAGDLTAAASGVKDSLVAVPPALDGVPDLVNGLFAKVTGLIDLGCLPVPQLPVSAPVAAEHHATAKLPGVPGLPLPSVPGLPLPSVSPGLPGVPGLGAVPVCTDLTADLLAAVSSLLAAVLSTGLPDLTKALDAVSGLLETVTGLTGSAEGCLPAAPVA